MAGHDAERAHSNTTGAGQLAQDYAATGFGCREIASVINAATMHSAPAAKNAGRYVASNVRDRPAPKAAIAAPI